LELVVLVAVHEEQLEDPEEEEELVDEREVEAVQVVEEGEFL
jgi:hypothetical protein